MAIQIKRGTKANWESNNPVLEDGQPGYQYNGSITDNGGAEYS